MHQDATDAAFEEMGEPAEYVSISGQRREVVILRDANPSISDPGFGRSGFILSPGRQTAALSILVRRSEVEEPAEGAQLVTADGRVHDVAETPAYDGFGVWRLTLRPCP